MTNNSPLAGHTDQASLKAMGMDGPPDTWTEDQRLAAGVDKGPRPATPLVGVDTAVAADKRRSSGGPLTTRDLPGRKATAAEEKGVAAEAKRTKK